MRWRELPERKKNKAGKGDIKCYRVEISEKAVRKTPLSKELTGVKELTTWILRRAFQKKATVCAKVLR